MYTDYMCLRWIFILSIIVPLVSGIIAQTQAADLPPATPTKTTEKHVSTPFFVLGPNTSFQNTMYDVCKHITNLTDDVNAYIPTAQNTWSDFDSRKNQNGKLIIEVKPCEQ